MSHNTRDNTNKQGSDRVAVFRRRTNTKQEFTDWLNEHKSKKFLPKQVVDCIQDVSDFAYSKRIITTDIWSTISSARFKQSYHAILGTRLFKVLDKQNHKMFYSAGQLYQRFLEEKYPARSEKPRVEEPEQTPEESTKQSADRSVLPSAPAAVIQRPAKVETETTEDAVIETTADAVVSAKAESESGNYLDLDNPDEGIKSRPVAFSVKGTRVELDKTNWTRLMVMMADHIITKEYKDSDSLTRTALYGTKFFLLTEAPEKGSFAELTGGSFITTGYTPAVTVRIIKALLDHCGIRESEVTIELEPKE